MSTTTRKAGPNAADRDGADRDAPSPLSIDKIVSYHAHIYYDPATTRGTAAVVRARIAEEFSVQLGRWHDVLVGPHQRPMYQVAFSSDLFARLVPWLMLNRLGLTVLVHPNTGSPREDHMTHAIWLGRVLPLDDRALPLVSDPQEDARIVPNTHPARPAG